LRLRMGGIMQLRIAATAAPQSTFRLCEASIFFEATGDAAGSSAAQAPGVIHQAIAAAYAGPGVAHLTLPQDVIAAKAEGTVPSVATLKPHSEFSASESDVVEIARRIESAGSVVIMCGAGCRRAADLLGALSNRLKAPLIHSSRAAG
jgi:pyruvate dehydrogenase (quinone)